MTPRKENKNKYYKRINQQIQILISTSLLMLRPPRVMSKILLRSKKHFSNFWLTRLIKSILNITIKELSRRQIIILMGTNNMERVIARSNMCVTNMNRFLKDIKLEILINFI